MGGHIDSWDTGSQTGANDDGGGSIRRATGAAVDGAISAIVWLPGV